METDFLEFVKNELIIYANTNFEELLLNLAKLLQQTSDSLTTIAQNFNLNESCGIFLDNLGEIIGFKRPYMYNQNIPIFAFRGCPLVTVGGFGKGLWLDFTNPTEITSAPDAYYRQLLQQRIILNFNSCTLEDLKNQITSMTAVPFKITIKNCEISIFFDGFLTIYAQYYIEKGYLILPAGINLAKAQDKSGWIIEG